MSHVACQWTESATHRAFCCSLSISFHAAGRKNKPIPARVRHKGSPTRTHHTLHKAWSLVHRDAQATQWTTRNDIHCMWYALIDEILHAHIQHISAQRMDVLMFFKNDKPCVYDKLHQRKAVTGSGENAIFLEVSKEMAKFSDETVLSVSLIPNGQAVRCKTIIQMPLYLTKFGCLRVCVWVCMYNDLYTAG